LFVGAGTVLAQDNADFFYDPAINTLKSKDQTNTNSTNFAVGSGNVTGSSSGNSGTVVVASGGGSPNTSGSAAAGNSGAVTIATGAGGDSDSGSAAGNAGNLNLKSGSGGGNAFSGATGGSAGHIILQPGSGGSGSTQGAGGSTIVRASNSGDILAVQNSAGSTTHVGVANNGNVRIGTASSAALLQLGAGTSTLPPLKLTAGTLLSSPAAGAVEFDGTDLFITLSNARRRFLTSQVANVLDFGAVGNGSADDSAAFQSAVDSLVETGGVVWVPPNRKYVVGNVNIIAKYPVWIVSEMYGHFLGSGSGSNQNLSASIVPKPGTGTTHIFKWERHSDLTTTGFGAGGGIRGLCLNDIVHGGTPFRQTAIGTAAVWVTDAAEFTIRECLFMWLNGSALKLEIGNFFQAENCNFDECGASGKPVIEVGGVISNANLFSRRLFIQAAYSGQIKMLGGALYHTDSYHENGAGLGGETQPIIDGTAGRVHVSDCFFWGHQAESIIIGVTESEVADCMFHNHPGTKHTIDVKSGGYSSRFSSLRMWRTGAGRSISLSSAHWCTLSDIHSIGGGIFSDSLETVVTGVFMYAPGPGEGQYAAHLTGAGSVLSGGVIGGQNSSTCHGAAVNGIVTGMIVRDLVGAASNGITGLSSDSCLVGNRVSNVTGAAYVYVNGQKASSNL
jgi:hypothetical protein